MAITLPAPARAAAAAAGPSAQAQAKAQRCWRSGQEHAATGQWPAAASAYQRAAELVADPAYELAAAHALLKAQRPGDAAALALRLRQQHPGEALGWTLSAHALYVLGRDEEVLACVAAMPAGLVRQHLLIVLHALALQRLRRHLDALPVFFEALALKLDDAVTHFRLGMSFKEMGMKSEAAECVRTAVLLGLGASAVVGRALIAFFEREACNWQAADAALADVRTAVLEAPPNTPLETSPFTHVVLVDDPLEQLKATTHYALHVAQGIRPLPRVAARARQQQRSDARLKIGYLSADFHFHATSQLMVQMLEHHDRSRFEITLLSTGPDDGSPMRQRVKAAAEHFVDLRHVGFKPMAERIRALGIDILVDLKGGTSDTLFPALAYRPAPLQVAWLGFPGTSGAPFIDYLIGDEIVTPLEHAAHFSEKIAQLPGCYQPNDAQRALPRPTLSSDWGLPERAAGTQGLVLCGFHQSYKISAEVFGTWCELLQALPGSVLWLLRWNKNVQATLERAAAERGIDPSRLVFAPVLKIEQHLSRLACADLFLDAWPCNAHTTAGEALWAGVPVVTLKGRAFVQRVAASLLHAVGLDELVCTDRAAYRDTALALARDDLRRSRLRAHLVQQRTGSPLFDGAGFAGRIEALYQRMWARVLKGEAPAALPAQPESRAGAAPATPTRTHIFAPNPPQAGMPSAR